MAWARGSEAGVNQLFWFACAAMSTGLSVGRAATAAFTPREPWFLSTGGVMAETRGKPRLYAWAYQTEETLR